MIVQLQTDDKLPLGQTMFDHEKKNSRSLETDKEKLLNKRCNKIL